MASGSSAAQKEVPVAVAAWSTMAAAVAARPRRIAPSTILLTIRVNVSEAPTHPLELPATCARAGSQTASRNTTPPTARAIAR
jgi:hypothetical protein